MEGFEATTSSADGVATVLLEGELDIASAPVLDASLADVEGNGTSTVVLDLAGVRFIDSTGLRSLLNARQRAETAGRTLRLTNIPVDVERVFDVTGVRRIFDIAPPA
jgi:anti-sigma B factor antagonist